jgi:hypothetical protein
VNRHVGTVQTYRSWQSRIRQAPGCSWANRAVYWESAPYYRTFHGLRRSPLPFRPVPFSLKLAPGVQIQASSYGLQTNRGPGTPNVYVGQQFANPASPAAPLTFYTPSGARREQPSYLLPQLPPTADKAQHAQALAAAIQGIRTLHHREFPLVQRLVVPYPPRPDHDAILQRRMNDALARVSIFRRSTRKAAQAAAVLATRMECNELEAAGEAQCRAVQQETDELWQRLIANDPDVVLAVLSHAFQTSSVQAAPLGVWEAEAQLALLAPDLAALPERHPTTTAAGNLSLKKFTKGEMADLYKQLVAGLVLATAKGAFAVAPGVTEIRIVVLRTTSADAYGKIRPEAMLAARVARATLSGVRWTKADALTILNRISSELVTRIAGPTKAFAPLGLKTEPEVARLIDDVTAGN